MALQWWWLRRDAWGVVWEAVDWLRRALLCCTGIGSNEVVEAEQRQWRQFRVSGGFAAMVVAVLGWLRWRYGRSGSVEMAVASVRAEVGLWGR